MLYALRIIGYLKLKTKTLISGTITAQLICIFVFVHAKSRFSYDAAHIVIGNRKTLNWLLVSFFASLLLYNKTIVDY